MNIINVILYLKVKEITLNIKWGNIMKLSQIVSLLEGEIIFGEELLNKEISQAYGADLLSDVLAYAKSGILLLTGLVNIQVVRTAEMLDLGGIVVVRGKKVDEGTIELAKECQIPLIRTDKTMFESCGILYKNGILPVELTKSNKE
ncbi:DRTGG domain-containing protein [Anaerobranca californiensis DSM 14826]|uniref:DRTGG domain-containing protein n=2 Tax=Anaerobranca TaxID=42447 RepID=A0A1M6NM53_9FIRM|nr:DRTGG domain-containing protein [Anaerobranca californiensis DSM 14826]